MVETFCAHNEYDWDKDFAFYQFYFPRSIGINDNISKYF